jgi:hypothetical protein
VLGKTVAFKEELVLVVDADSVKERAPAHARLDFFGRLKMERCCRLQALRVEGGPFESQAHERFGRPIVVRGAATEAADGAKE